MQAVKGYLDNGVFKPSDGVELPGYAKVILVIEEAMSKTVTMPNEKWEEERQARMKWLDTIEAELDLIDDEDLSNFPKQGMMKLP